MDVAARPRAVDAAAVECGALGVDLIIAVSPHGDGRSVETRLLSAVDG